MILYFWNFWNSHICLLRVTYFDLVISSTSWNGHSCFNTLSKKGILSYFLVCWNGQTFFQSNRFWSHHFQEVSNGHRCFGALLTLHGWEQNISTLFAGKIFIAHQDEEFYSKPETRFLNSEISPSRSLESDVSLWEVFQKILVPSLTCQKVWTKISPVLRRAGW